MRRLAMGAMWSLAAAFTAVLCAAPVRADGELPPGSGPPGKTFTIILAGVVVALVVFVSWRMLRRIAKERREAEEAAEEYARYHGHPPGDER